MKRVHFIGIGGSGLSAMAKVLLEQGTTVSGSDRQSVAVMDELQAMGAYIVEEHRAENVLGADIVVRSSAVSEDNVEVRAALSAGIPVLRRAQFLPLLTAKADVVAIAGTHGKTTTTAMIAWMFTYMGLDPSYIIGGRSLNLNSSAHSGQGKWFVIEADEYDGMFLGLEPTIGVVTNVEHDHIDCYPTYAQFFQAFAEFAGRIKPNGWLIVNAQDDGARRLGEELRSSDIHVHTYGWQDSVDFRAKDISLGEVGGFRFYFEARSGKGAWVDLQVPGKHNVLNALAAMAVSEVLGLDLPQAAQALGNYQGTSRRFDLLGIARGVTIINDYAHHPTEIRATLEAARGRYPRSRLWAVWQPHTYSRARAFFDQFVQAFELADEVVILEIYAAREPQPTDGFSASQIVEAMRALPAYQAKRVRYQPQAQEALFDLVENLRSGDVVLVLSAGDAIDLSDKLYALLQTYELGKESEGLDAPGVSNEEI